MKDKQSEFDKNYKKLLAINRGSKATKETKLVHHFTKKEDRLANWQFAREDYDSWRKSESAKKWLARKRVRQSNLCFICLTDLDKFVHVDHVFPIFLGGTSSFNNLCLTHPYCNMDKGAKVTMTYKEALERRRLLNKITLGVKTLKTLSKKPNYIPTKKQQECIDLANKYISKN